MELQVRVEPDPVLRAVCAPVALIDQRVAALAAQMVACMEQARGIGLAAPQIGRPERLFVVHAPHDQPRVFVNPTILARSSEQVEMQEGCLSIPHIYGYVVRARDITVQAHDQQGQPFVLEATGMLARVILHEYDHLEGVLFWDHLPPKQRKKLQKQYAP